MNREIAEHKAEHETMGREVSAAMSGENAALLPPFRKRARPPGRGGAGVWRRAGSMIPMEQRPVNLRMPRLLIRLQMFRLSTRLEIPRSSINLQMQLLKGSMTKLVNKLRKAPHSKTKLQRPSL